MKHSIVLGWAFGDEGKGATTQWLCRQALKYGRKPVVVRFNGGAQAAHTVVLDGEEHICSTYGSGVLLGVPTFLSKDFFFDPIAANNEYQTLKTKAPKLSVHPYCRIVTPYDILAGIHNAKVVSDGTCGKGIYQTFSRYASASFPSILPQKDREDVGRMFLQQVRCYYQAEKDYALEDLFVQAMHELPLAVASELPQTDDAELVYEGAQGLLLDMDYGFYPNVTPSHTGLDNLDAATLDRANVYLVTRTYTTRHGNGYEPRHPLTWDLTTKHETNVENEYQGRFKTGVLDFDLLSKAIERHHLDVWQQKRQLQYHLMVTHGDVALRHGYIEYLSHNQLFREKIESPKDLTQLFIRQMDETSIRFQSIKVSLSEEGLPA